MTDKPSVKQQPKSQAIRTALCDLNGVARGKRIPAVQIDKALQGATRMPLSSTMVDIWGRDIHGSEFIFDTGDGDGICQSIRDKVLPAPWLGPQAGTIPVWMYTEDGEPSDIDPRHALAAVIQRFKEKNLTPVVATELEFYLLPIDSNNTELDVEEIYSVQQLDRLSPLLDDIYAACEAQGIAADAATSERVPMVIVQLLWPNPKAQMQVTGCIYIFHYLMQKDIMSLTTARTRDRICLALQ